MHIENIGGVKIEDRSTPVNPTEALAKIEEAERLLGADVEECQRVFAEVEDRYTDPVLRERGANVRWGINEADIKGKYEKYKKEWNKVMLLVGTVGGGLGLLINTVIMEVNNTPDMGDRIMQGAGASAKFVAAIWIIGRAINLLRQAFETKDNDKQRETYLKFQP